MKLCAVIIVCLQEPGKAKYVNTTFQFDRLSKLIRFDTAATIIFESVGSLGQRYLYYFVRYL